MLVHYRHDIHAAFPLFFCFAAVASRVRGAVAAVQFDDFHKNSAKIIRASVFGIDGNGKVRDRFGFPSNNLAITSIDIQVCSCASVELWYH